MKGNFWYGTIYLHSVGVGFKSYCRLPNYPSLLKGQLKFQQNSCLDHPLFLPLLPMPEQNEKDVQ